MSRKVLLIESDSADANTVRDALINSHDAAFPVEWLGPCTAGLKRLAGDCEAQNSESGAIAAILLDLFLPDSEGIQTFDRVFRGLSHLKRFPIDTLKIDHTFVRDIASSAGDAAILGLVIGMGRSLNMRVVAEGVETSEELAALLEHGCTAGRGHYFGKAMEARESSHLQRQARPSVRQRSPCAPSGGTEAVAAASGKA